MEGKNSVITIGRQYGAGGREIGRRLAYSLGIGFYDKQILRMVSDESGIDESYFHLADEKAGGNLLYRVVRGIKPTLTKPSIGSDLVSEDNLFLFQSEVIQKLAEHESCVIVGRCGDYVLDDHKDVTKVFLYSRLQSRMQRIMDTDKLSEKDALKHIRRNDKERDEYYRYYTGKGWGEMDNYHINIDSGLLGIEKSVQLILEYLRIKKAG